MYSFIILKCHVILSDWEGPSQKKMFFSGLFLSPSQWFCLVGLSALRPPPKNKKQNRPLASCHKTRSLWKCASKNRLFAESGYYFRKLTTKLRRFILFRHIAHHIKRLDFRTLRHFSLSVCWCELIKITYKWVIFGLSSLSSFNLYRLWIGGCFCLLLFVRCACVCVHVWTMFGLFGVIIDDDSKVTN